MPAAASALPTPKHVPAPHCAAGTVPVRGVVADDGHANDKGKGHEVHGNGFGYGHGCGGDADGGSGGGGGEPEPV